MNTARNYLQSIRGEAETEEEALQKLIVSHRRLRADKIEEMKKFRELANWKKRIGVWLGLV